MCRPATHLLSRSDVSAARHRPDPRSPATTHAALLLLGLACSADPLAKTTDPFAEGSGSPSAEVDTGASSETAASETPEDTSATTGTSTDTEDPSGGTTSSGAGSDGTETTTEGSTATGDTDSNTATDPTDASSSATTELETTESTDTNDSNPTVDPVTDTNSESTTSNATTDDGTSTGGGGGPDCGNGQVEPGEPCDDGPDNGDGTSTCTPWCTLNTCGDGYLHEDEACDDGTLNGNGASSCKNNCTPNVCGDLYLHLPSEACDEGPFPTETCDEDCTAVACGDGLVNDEAGEVCDDGDANDGNGCSNACVRTYDQLSVGDTHACVRGPAGNVRCWGPNAFGRLGYGNLFAIGDNEVPASAGDVDLGGIAEQVAAGTYSTCARLDDGALRCWGYAASGQLGYGNNTTIGDSESPASAGDVLVGEDVVQIAVGGRHACALVGVGLVRCWGEAEYGQLGYGNTNDIGDNEAPSTAGIVDVGGLATQIEAGEDHTCALLTDGAIRCWGRFDALGYPNIGGNVGDNEVPDDLGDVDIGGTVVQIALGAVHTCARLDDGAVRCWGRAEGGRLGYGDLDYVGFNNTPASAGDIDLGGAALDIATGRWHTCAVLVGGAVRCWGFGGNGALGYGNTNDIGDGETPASAGDVDLGAGAIDVDVGDQYNCALLEDHRVKCWGQGDFGVLGYGNVLDIGDNETPDSVGVLDL